MILKLNGLYKIRNSIYDPWDERAYIIRITDLPTVYSNHEHYYKAEIIKMGTHVFANVQKIYLYPQDWEEMEELSSLEIELL